MLNSALSTLNKNFIAQTSHVTRARQSLVDPGHARCSSNARTWEFDLQSIRYIPPHATYSVWPGRPESG